MNWVAQIEEFTLWLLNHHRLHQMLRRIDEARRDRERRHSEIRHHKQARKRAHEVLHAEVHQPQVKAQETRELLAEHRAWNAARGGKWQHFG